MNHDKIIIIYLFCFTFWCSKLIYLCELCFFLVHPCDLPTNGGCDQVCNKDGVNASCSCDDGFKLADNGLACNKSK